MLSSNLKKLNIILTFLGFISICQLFINEHYLDKINYLSKPSSGILTEKTALFNNNVSILIRSVKKLIKLKELTDNKLQNIFTELTNNLPEFPEEHVQSFLKFNKKINSINNDILALREKIHSLDKFHSNQTNPIKKLAEINISSIQHIDQTQVKVSLDLNCFYDNGEIIILDFDGNPVYYWIENLNDRRIDFWIKVPLIKKGDSVRYYFCLRNSKINSLINSYWNNGKKVFNFYSDKDYFHEWKLNEKQLSNSFNIFLLPSENGLVIDTSGHRKDASVFIDFPEISSNSVFNYAFKNFPVNGYSFQFIASLSDLESNNIIAALDSPKYLSDMVAYRKQCGNYQEYLLGKIEYLKWYKAFHYIDFEKQKVDYKVSGNNVNYTLYNQCFRGDGTTVHCKHPLISGFSRVTLGSCCLDDLGLTDIAYLFIRKYNGYNPELKIKMLL